MTFKSYVTDGGREIPVVVEYRYYPEPPQIELTSVKMSESPFWELHPLDEANDERLTEAAEEEEDERRSKAGQRPDRLLPALQKRE